MLKDYINSFTYNGHSSAGYTSEYVTSANRSAYPDSGLQNEYRYEYRGTIGQALTKVSTISN